MTTMSTAPIIGRETGTVTPRPGQPEGGHAHENEPRVEPVQGLPVESKIPEYANREIFDHDVGLLDQLTQQAEPFFIVQR